MAKLTIDGKEIQCRIGRQSWEAIEPLQESGQGVVYRAFATPLGGDPILALVNAIHEVGSAAGPGMNPKARLETALCKFLLRGPPEMVALKVYRARKDQDPAQMRQRFDEEVRVLSRAVHPNIVALLDHGEQEDGTPFLVLPFYARGNLCQARSAYIGQPLACLRAIAKLLEPVCALHREDLVHRDIKPENILISDDGTPVLADFGLVFKADRAPSVTRTGEHPGNWQFGPPWARIKPEFQRSKQVDLYSLGHVLWWLASGHEQTLPSPTDWAHPEFDLKLLFPNVAESMQRLESILSRVLAARPDASQYPSADAMREDIDSVIAELETRRRKSSAPAACLACRTGRYKKAQQPVIQDLISWQTKANAAPDLKPADVITAMDQYRCDRCGHLAWYASHPSTD